MERRLSAIFAADMVGYSALMEADEVGTLQRQNVYRSQLFEPTIDTFHGRIVKNLGDGVLVEFPSIVDAVQCAVQIQRSMAKSETEVPKERRIAYRIGINSGDIIVDGDDIYGDGVNIASRMESIADPGGICISGTAFDQIRSDLDVGFQSLGEIRVKNIRRPIRAYNVILNGHNSSITHKRSYFAHPYSSFKNLSLIAVIVPLALVAGLWAWIAMDSGEIRLPAQRISSNQLSNDRSIAVLPFDNLSADPTQDYFSDGITEDLITDISRIADLFVVARQTMMTFKNKVVTARDVSSELGVRYVLDGSVRKVGDRVRINAELVDAASGRQLWADRYDRKIDDIFTLQDDVIRNIVSALQIKLTPQEENRITNTTHVDPEAYDQLLRGLERYRRFTKETNLQARQYFERAVAIDPQFARGYADIGLTYAEELFQGWSVEPGDAEAIAISMAKRALSMEPDNRQARWTLALTHLTRRRYDEALLQIGHMLAVDPNHADSYAQQALIMNYIGKADESLELIQKAKRLNPKYPFFYTWIEAQANYFLKNTDDAIKLFEQVIARNGDFVIAHIMLASSYAQAGRLEDAKWEVEEVLLRHPGFSVSSEEASSAYRDEEYQRIYLSGLRKAGFPQG